MSLIHRDRAASGSALLMVVGATAAIGTLAAALLAAALVSYETAVLRHDGTQARLLAESALDLAGAEIAAGRLRIPARVGEEVDWAGAPPPPPPGFEAPESMSAATCAFRVGLSAVPGSQGRRRQRAVSGPGPLLVDAVAEGRCGRGHAVLEARFAVFDDLSTVRLY